RRPVLAWPAAGCALTAGLFLFLPHPLDQLRLSPGESIAAHQNGIMADVTVVRDARQNFHLMVNNHYQMGGTASRYSDQRQALIPLMLHPDPQRMLFLGLGTGTTAAAAAQYDELQVDGVELIPEIVPLMFYFQPSLKRIGGPENLTIFTADARRFVLASPSAYDVIVADLFHPSRDGAGFLYTREHFQAIRERLSDDGIFCQWLPLYQMDIDLLRLITRTFLDVFPDGGALLAHHSLTQPIIGLIAGRKPLQVNVQAFDTRLASHPALARDLRAVGLTSVYTLLGNYLADAAQLRAFAGAGPLNTDDHPAVLFQAPRFVYRTAADLSASDRLLALVQAFSPHPADILTASATQTQQMRLAAYWQARNAYLATGAHIRPTPDVDSLIAQVVNPLMAIVRTSPDFEAAYRPLLKVAARLYHQDPQKASRLLLGLENAAPARPEAGEMRLALFQGIE
uniref:spermidine synthase n=1 Tax=Desulfosarcina cetonica TaxID=90730 RepID=UPI000ADB84C8